MSFWIIVLGAVMLAALACAVYLISRILKFSVFNKLYKRKKALGIIAAAATLIAPVAVLYCLLGMMNAVICVIHLALIWIVTDIISFLISREKKNFNVCGIVAVALTVVYLGGCWFMAHHITAKKYSLETDKNVDGLRIIQIADAHIGTTFDGEKFRKAAAKMKEFSPDVILITGDLVDNGTNQKDLEECCRALEEIEPEYGIYFSYGNHDRSFRSDMLKNAGEGRLAAILDRYGITVLADISFQICDGYIVAGRRDYNEGSRETGFAGGRLSADELLAEIDPANYIIVLDHQPRDYDAEAAAGADLVLSGHTHGGQMFPLAPLVKILGGNDLVYGHERRGNTDFIVTSGISDWELKFKSGCGSEFTVIDINK